MRVEARVFLLCQLRDFKSMVESIFFEGLLAVDFGGAARCVDDVFIDSTNVFFCLSVSVT